mgnify:FL=1
MPFMPKVGGKKVLHWPDLVKHLELVALALYPRQGFGQDFLQFVYALEAVMKGDDAAVAGIALHVFQHLPGSES